MIKVNPCYKRIYSPDVPKLNINEDFDTIIEARKFINKLVGKNILVLINKYRTGRVNVCIENITVDYFKGYKIIIKELK